MKLSKCDNCKKESVEESNEYCGDFFDCSLFIKETDDIFKQRIDYTKKIYGEIIDEGFKRRKELEFCSEKCLVEYIDSGKLKNLFDDWREYTDSLTREKKPLN